MKKIIFATFLAAIALNGCQKEDQALGQIAGEEVSVVMSASIPQELQTYGVSSAQGGIDNCETDMYIRYIMDVYWQNQTGNKDVIRVARQIVYKKIEDANLSACKSVVFEPMKMIPAEYDFVFWADIVKKETNKDNQIGDLLNDGNEYYVNPYFTSDNEGRLAANKTSTTYEEGTLQEIRFRANIGNREDMDAFTAHKTIDLRTEAATQSIGLKRPFAKLRIVATDADMLKTPDGKTMKAKFEIGYSENIPNTFDASTGKISYVENIFANYGLPNVPNYTGEGANSERTLYIAYLLPPISPQNMKLKISLSEDTQPGTPPSEEYGEFSYEINTVPFYVNKLTTIKGNLFTTKASMSVEIQDGFDTPAVEEEIVTNVDVASLDELKSTLNGKDQEITLNCLISKANGLTLDFSDVQRVITRNTSSPIYTEGNKAKLTLNLPNMEEGALVTLTAEKPENAPDVLYVNTKTTTCSLRANMPKTAVLLEGEAFNSVFLICALRSLNNSSIVSGFTKPVVGDAEAPVSKGYLFLIRGIAFSLYFTHFYELNGDGTVSRQLCNNSSVGHGESTDCSFTGTPWDFVGGVNDPVP